MNKKTKKTIRVWWKGMLGTVLAAGRFNYFVVFGEYCQFVPKDECSLVYGCKNARVNGE
jgi:hypothetical protein